MTGTGGSGRRLTLLIRVHTQPLVGRLGLFKRRERAVGVKSRPDISVGIRKGLASGQCLCQTPEWTKVEMWADGVVRLGLTSTTRRHTWERQCSRGAPAWSPSSRRAEDGLRGRCGCPRQSHVLRQLVTLFVFRISFCPVLGVCLLLLPLSTCPARRQPRSTHQQMTGR